MCRVGIWPEVFAMYLLCNPTDRVLKYTLNLMKEACCMHLAAFQDVGVCPPEQLLMLRTCFAKFTVASQVRPRLTGD